MRGDLSLDFPKGNTVSKQGKEGSWHMWAPQGYSPHPKNSIFIPSLKET